jgi:hypothetical protein
MMRTIREEKRWPRQQKDNSELVAGVQVIDDVQVEGAVLEEVVGEHS